MREENRPAAVNNTVWNKAVRMSGSVRQQLLFALDFQYTETFTRSHRVLV